MYAKILAAVNEFTNSEMAAHYAIALARSCRAGLLLTFIAEDGMPAAAFRHAESALGRLFIEAGKRGVAVESITGSGDPVPRIAAIARERDVDLAFIATRREDVEKRFFVRTRARGLMAQLPCSVAMARVVHMRKGHPRNILVPLKGRISHIDERAYFTAKLAEGLDSPLILFHLPRPLATLFRRTSPVAPVERERRLPREVERFVEQIRRHGVTHERRTGRGGIARSITTEAAFTRSDLIVMGASERSLLRNILSGNHVEQVLRETPCNLIVFRPRHQPPQGNRRF